MMAKRASKFSKRRSPKSRTRKRVFSKSQLGRTYGITRSLAPAALSGPKTVTVKIRDFLIQDLSSNVCNYLGNLAVVDLSYLFQTYTGDWQRWAALYDEYRIAKVSLRFVPVTDAYLAGTITLPTLGAEPAICLAYDSVYPSSLGSPPITVVMHNANSKVFNLHKDWEWSSTCFATESSSSKEQLWDQFQSPHNGMGAVMMALTANTNSVGFLSNPGYGTLMWTLDVKLRGPKF